jgi:hypothetical protein
MCIICIFKLFKEFVLYIYNTHQMNAHANSMVNDPILNSEIKNKGFAILDELFKKNGWNLQKNEINWINYTKFGDETSCFDIKISTEKIIVSVPLKNSIYQFVTTFKGYYEASEYIEQKFKDYVN